VRLYPNIGVDPAFEILTTSQYSLTYNLPVGTSTFTFNVQSQNGLWFSNYTMAITRDPSDSAYLISCDYVPTSPFITQAAAFNGGLLFYTMHVMNAVNYLNFTAMDQDTGTMSFLGWYLGTPVPDGNVLPRSRISQMQLGVPSKPVSLSVPFTTINIVACAQDGITNLTYTFNVTRDVNFTPTDYFPIRRFDLLNLLLFSFFSFLFSHPTLLLYLTYCSIRWIQPLLDQSYNNRFRRII
jgi:hypothetical protein